MNHDVTGLWPATSPPPVHPPSAAPSPRGHAARFAALASTIEARHDAQSLDDVMELREKYAAPVFGSVSPWSLVEMLGQCVDPSDQRLYCTSQQVHLLQMIDAMEAEGAATPELLLVALVHDFGKVLLLTDEAPENVVCMNRPLQAGTPGCGLDRCVFQWNHDEWAYARFKDHLPDHLGWLVRYHSILPATCMHLMDARDLDYCRRYLKPFARYDHGSKSPCNLPQRRIGDYRAVIERALPAKMSF
ncbi:MAG: inositol oxygenase family protein [Betaproteobacteria bacterium]